MILLGTPFDEEVGDGVAAVLFTAARSRQSPQDLESPKGFFNFIGDHDNSSFIGAFI